MNVFGPVFQRELALRLRSPICWILFAILFAYSASLMLGARSEAIAAGDIARNSPFTLQYLSMYSGFWAALFGPIIVAGPMLNDVRTRFAPLVFTTPIRDGDYFWGKFLAGLIGFTVVLAGTPVALVTVPLMVHAAGMPMAAEFLPATPWVHILQATVVWVMPAAVIFGAIHFALAAATGKNLASYGFAVASLAIFTLFFVGFDADTAHHFWIEVIDPMGKQTLDAQALKWSVPERASRLLAAEPALLANRVGYVVLAIIVLTLARWRFSFGTFLANAARGESKKTRRGGDDAAAVVSRILHSTRQPARGPRDALEAICLATFMGARDWRTTWRGSAFRLVIVALLMLAVTSGWSASAEYYNAPENHLLPSAQHLLSIVQPQLCLLVMTVAIYFSAELIGREHDARMASLLDASPVNSSVLAGAKWIAVTLLALSLSTLPSVAVLILQLLNGYVETTPSHFIRSTLLHLAPITVAYSWLTIGIYGLTRSRVVCQALPILILWACVAMKESATIEQHLFLLGPPLDMLFSDFDVLGASTARHLHYAAYLLGVTGFCAAVGFWLWPRGTNAVLSQRLRLVASNRTMFTVALSTLSIAGAVAGGAGILRQLDLHHQTLEQQYAEAEQYERRYARLRDLPQPQVEALRLVVELDPDVKRIRYQGTFQLVNRSTQAIADLYLTIPKFAKLTGVATSTTDLGADIRDATHGVVSYRLPSALAAGASMSLSFRMTASMSGFSYAPFEGNIGADSVLFDTTFLPVFGYDRERELDVSAQRRQRLLGPRRPPHSNAYALAANEEAGRVDIDLTVSAPASVRLSANGEIVNQRVAHGRRIGQFQMRDSSLELLVAASRLIERHEAWALPDGRSVRLIVQRHPDHAANERRIADTARFIVAEMERRFGPYPFQTLQLVELAQFREGEDFLSPRSAGNLVVIPERKGWLHDYRREPSRDYLTFTLADALSRAWWGQQVAASAGPGAALIDEGLPTLMGLLMLEIRHGTTAADDYASVLRNRYEKELARSDGPTPDLLSTAFESYAGLRAGLALYDARRDMGSVEFDQKLTSFFRTNAYEKSLQGAATPAQLATALDLAARAPCQQTGQPRTQHARSLCAAGEGG